MLRALQEIGRVDILMLRSAASTAVNVPGDGRFLAEATYRQLPLGIQKYSPDATLNRLLAPHLDLRAYDVVCGRYLEPVSKLELPESVPSIVDLDDVGYEYSSSGSFVSRIAAAGRSAVRRRLERPALKRFSRCWFVCEKDRCRISDLAGGILPNVPIGAPSSGELKSSGGTLLFVGALWYPPNREGIERFLAECWPQIRMAEPDARLHLVGPAPQADRDRWNQVDGVTAPGFVPDLDSAYARAAFTIAPIYSGGGSNIKVLESCTRGRACVTTTHCLDGLRPHFNGDTDIVATAGDTQMIESCIRLLREPALRNTIAGNGRRIVAQRFNYETFRRAVHEQVRLAAWGGIVTSAALPVMVLAHNEESRIGPCLNSIFAAQPGERCDVYVLANGCTDRTEETVREFARTRPEVHLVSLPVADKCHAWNVFIHEVVPSQCPAREVYFFISGDSRVVPGSFEVMARALREHPHASAASAAPSSGRNRDSYRKGLLTSRGLLGNLYSLRGSFVERLRELSVRMPLNLEGDDGLVGALVKYDLCPERGCVDDQRIVPCADAAFEFDSLSPLNAADWLSYWKRLVRYGRSRYEFQLLGKRLLSLGLAGLPADITELYGEADSLKLRWQGVYTITNLVALREMRRTGRGQAPAVHDNEAASP